MCHEEIQCQKAANLIVVQKENKNITNVDLKKKSELVIAISSFF